MTGADRVDPAAWITLREHLTKAAALLAQLRKAHEPQLDFRHYSKLQFAQTAVEKFVADVHEVGQAVGVSPARG